jgi:hypothetical protein
MAAEQAEALSNLTGDIQAYVSTLWLISSTFLIFFMCAPAPGLCLRRRRVGCHLSRFRVRLELPPPPPCG